MSWTVLSKTKTQQPDAADTPQMLVSKNSWVFKTESKKNMGLKSIEYLAWDRITDMDGVDPVGGPKSDRSW